MQIKSVLTVRKAAEATNEQGKELFLKMKTGASLESVAADNELEVISHGAIRRDDNRVPQGLSYQAFSMPRPAEGDRVVDGLSQADGSFALIELNAVQAGLR